MKSFVDAELVKVQLPANEPAGTPQKFARFDVVTDYLDRKTYEIGGSKPSFLNFQFTHQPLYAVVKFCAVEHDRHDQVPVRCRAAQADMRPGQLAERLHDPRA